MRVTGDTSYITQTKYFTKDVEIISDLYKKGKIKEILEKYPDMSKQSLYQLMNRNNVERGGYYWSNSDIEKLKTYYGKIPMKDLLKMLDKEATMSAMQTKAEKLGLKSREYWSEEDKEKLKELYPITTTEELTRIFNRTSGSINREATILRLRKKEEGLGKFHRGYKEEELAFVKENWLDMTDEEMAKVLDRSVPGIRGIRTKLKLLRTGKKSYEDIYEFFRRNNTEWKKKSMRACNFKCVITGERFDEIHHLYGFHLIVDQTFKELDLEKREDLYSYTEKQQRKLLEKFREIQDRHPLGVCLTKEVHSDFHKKYGYGNNTIEQWNEYIKTKVA